VSHTGRLAWAHTMHLGRAPRAPQHPALQTRRCKSQYVACPAGTTNSAGNDASGADTVYTATSCATNERMVNHSCVVCPGGKTSRGEHDASGADTLCNATAYASNVNVVNHTCVVCSGGKTSSGEHDASVAGTLCNATSCATKVKVVNHTCAGCPGGRLAVVNTLPLGRAPCAIQHLAPLMSRW
jgi:hypothetical protein